MLTRPASQDAKISENFRRFLISLSGHERVSRGLWRSAE
jgi:hypothetical protein